MKIKGVIFDLDGTVVENSYDWLRIREELGTGATSILTYLDSLEGTERSRKWSILETHEAEQTAASVLRGGVRGLLGLLRERGIATALVTNNSRKNTDFLLNKFGLVFDCVITRESGLWKPLSEIPASTSWPRSTPASASSSSSPVSPKSSPASPSRSSPTWLSSRHTWNPSSLSDPPSPQMEQNGGLRCIKG
jgi:hypothetical protein